VRLRDHPEVAHPGEGGKPTNTTIETGELEEEEESGQRDVTARI